tara:strand:- start:1709 stop:1990 length:282 start_codon:yes stop_codon:yes gene_type:complete
MEKRTRIWNETSRTKADLDFMTHTEKQDAYVDSYYNWISECRGQCGHHVHVGEFMDTQDGICPNCGTEHETFMPLFYGATMGKVVFKKKSTNN